MKQTFAPIAVFAYRRTKTLMLVLDALEKCPEFLDSRVFVFSDGGRDAKSRQDVAAVRKLVRERLRPNMTLVEATANKGLAKSIIEGVTKLCDDYGKAIVIEDDLIVAPGALTWLNAGLDRYADDDKVWQVTLHQWQVPEFMTRSEGVFLNMTSSWGWATWKRAWDRFDLSACGWEEVREKPDIRKRFDVGGVYPYSEMLEQAQAGAVDSWAVRFWWSVFRAEGVTLFPPRSLITNVGFDSLATNYRFGFLRSLFRKRGEAPVNGPSPMIPASRPAESPQDRAAIARAIDRSRHSGLLGSLRY